MKLLFGSLSGKKTYIAAAISILGAVAGYLTGDVTAIQAFQLISSSILASGIRHGMENS